MFSIRSSTFARRSLAALALIAVFPAVTGCNLKYKRPAEAANDEIAIDEAMAIRTWPQQDADFANSTLEAFRNRFPYDYQTTKDQRADQGYVASPLAFMVQSVVFPFTFIKNPPGTKQTFSTLTYEPTYTANPSRPTPVATDIERMPQGRPATQP